LAVLRELWRWRDQEARRANQPSRRVLRDEMLIEIAKRRPATVAELFDLRGLERGSVRNAGPAIVAAVAQALQLDPSAYPELLRRDDPPQVSVLGQLLSVAAGSLAEEHEVDPALLATSSDLQDLVRWKLGLLPAEPEPAVLQGWRGEILGHSLLEILDGKRVLRVGDVKKRHPLVFESKS
jgi:ribonuclease D